MKEEKLDLILKKIEKLEDKIEDNNSILHGERNSKRWAKLFWIIKWIFIIAAGIVAWSYIQPIYKSAMEAYNNVLKTSSEARKTLGGINKSLDQLPNTEDFSLENLKKKLIK